LGIEYSGANEDDYICQVEENANQILRDCHFETESEIFNKKACLKKKTK